MTHPFRLDFRMRAGRAMGKAWGQWRPYWKRYATAERREAAMTGMNRQNTLFEYRVAQENESVPRD